MNKALLVIDLQRKYIDKVYGEDVVFAANSVIGENLDNTVVYIKNISKYKFRNKGTELADNLNVVSEHIFTKQAGDAFTNPELKQFLDSRQIDTVEIIGVDGGACVVMTAVGAVNNGYKVIVNTQAIATRPLLEKRRDIYFAKLKFMGAEIRLGEK